MAAQKNISNSLDELIYIVFDMMSCDPSLGTHSDCIPSKLLVNFQVVVCDLIDHLYDDKRLAIVRDLLQRSAVPDELDSLLQDIAWLYNHERRSHGRRQHRVSVHASSQLIRIPRPLLSKIVDVFIGQALAYGPFIHIVAMINEHTVMFEITNEFDAESSSRDSHVVEEPEPDDENRFPPVLKLAKFVVQTLLGGQDFLVESSHGLYRARFSIPRAA
jgi:hypothetical protein